MSNFRDMDRQTGFLLPPSVDEWLPQRHLARFVVEVIDGLDLRALVGSYRGSGSASYHPSMSQPVLRPRSRRCWRPDGRRITPPWTSALPRHRRCQSTRRRSKPCCIAWRRLKARSSTLSANISRSRCSASSSRFSASDNFCCAGSTRFAASGAWCHGLECKADVHPQCSAGRCPPRVIQP
jgi:hypothetical protein